MKQLSFYSIAAFDTYERDGPGGWITPNCRMAGRSSRVAQCSASVPRQ